MPRVKKIYLKNNKHYELKQTHKKERRIYTLATFKTKEGRNDAVFRSCRASHDIGF